MKATYPGVFLVNRILDKGKASRETHLRETVFRWLEDGMDSPYLLSFIIDIYEEDLEKGTAVVGTLTKAQEVNNDCVYMINYNISILNKVIVMFQFFLTWFLFQLCKMLATDIDCIRKEYWNYVSRRLNEKYGKKGE
jgi:hypothetical protein